MAAAPGAVRVALMVLALLMAGWLVVGLRTSELESDAQTVLDRVSENPPPAEIEEAIDDLREARRYNADETPAANQALLLWEAGRLEQATDLAEQVVATEPRNVEGWFVLWATSLVAGQRERAAQAFGQVRALDPLRARALERFDPQAQSRSE